jgi:hypothetical protein
MKRGDRRTYYRIRPGSWTVLVEQQIQMIAKLRQLAKQGLGLLNEEPAVRQDRLYELHNLTTFYERECLALIERCHRDVDQVHETPLASLPRHRRASPRCPPHRAGPALASSNFSHPLTAALRSGVVRVVPRMGYRPGSGCRAAAETGGDHAAARLRRTEGEVPGGLLRVCEPGPNVVGAVPQ